MLRVSLLCSTALLVIGCAAGTKPSESATKQGSHDPKGGPVLGDPVASIDSLTLFAAYAENEAKADMDYTNKTVELTNQGGALKVSKDASGSYVLGFTIVEFGTVSPARYAKLTSQEKKWFNEGYPPNVICRLEAESVEAASKLKTGAKCVVRGICEGRKPAKDVYKDYIVTLKNCKIIEPR